MNCDGNRCYLGPAPVNYDKVSKPVNYKRNTKFDWCLNDCKNDNEGNCCYNNCVIKNK